MMLPAESTSRSELMYWDTASADSLIRKEHPIPRRQTGMQFPLKASSGKRVPFRGDILGCSFRNDLPRESVSRSGASNWDAVSAWRPKGKRHPISRAAPRRCLRPWPPPPAFPQIKLVKTNMSLFWQVLEANGKGNLMVVTGYGSGASVGLGNGAHHG